MQFRMAVIAAAATFAVLAPLSADAATVDAFTTFNGTNGAGGFNYFIFTAPPPAATTAGMVSSVSCPLGTQCLRSSNPLNDAAVFKAGPLTPSVVADDLGGFISVPQNQLIIDPDTFGGGVAFLAPSAGAYGIHFQFDALHTLATGVNLFFFAGGNVTALAPNNTVLSNFQYNDTVQLLAGQVVGFSVRPGTAASNDQTGFSFTVTTPASVPEPTTWGLMIVGMGGVGVALRRRRITVVA